MSGSIREMRDWCLSGGDQRELEGAYSNNNESVPIKREELLLLREDWLSSKGIQDSGRVSTPFDKYL